MPGKWFYTNGRILEEIDINGAIFCVQKHGRIQDSTEVLLGTFGGVL